MKPFLKNTSFHSKCQQPKNLSFVISNVFVSERQKKNEEESKVMFTFFFSSPLFMKRCRQQIIKMNQLTRNKEKQKSHYVFFPSDELFITRVSSEKKMKWEWRRKKDKKKKVLFLKKLEGDGIGEFAVWQLAPDKNKLVGLEQKKPNKRSILICYFARRVEQPSLAVIAKARIRQTFTQPKKSVPEKKICAAT